MLLIIQNKTHNCKKDFFIPKLTSASSWLTDLQAKPPDLLGSKHRLTHRPHHGSVLKFLDATYVYTPATIALALTGCSKETELLHIIFAIVQPCQWGTVASPAMGHWGTCSPRNRWAAKFLLWRLECQWRTRSAYSRSTYRWCCVYNCCIRLLVLYKIHLYASSSWCLQRRSLQVCVHI